MTTLEKLTTEIKTTYENATQSWTGWEWTHSFGAHDDDCKYCGGLSLCGSQIAIEPTDPDIDAPPADACEHYLSALKSAREYRDTCAASAHHAECLAEDAMDHILNSDYDAALACLDNACSEESHYGDCPTWEPVRSAIEATIRELNQEQPFPAAIAST